MDPDVTNANVTVKFPNLSTTKLVITDIRAENVPEGMEVEFWTKSLEVTLRGDKNLIARVTPEAVAAVVDFTDAQLGTYTIKSNITLSGAFSSIGAIGSYSVSVTVRSAPN